VLAIAHTRAWPSVPSDAVSTWKHATSDLNTQPTDTPVQRFGCGLTTALAWLGTRVVRYPFPVRLCHSLLHAGLSRRIQAEAPAPQRTGIRASTIPGVCRPTVGVSEWIPRSYLPRT
jgi:hypothetical protein